MKTNAALAILVLFLILAASGCGQKRVAPYAPRIPDTKEHKALVSDEECLDCHEIKALPDHKPSDTCFDCHRKIPGR